MYSVPMAIIDFVPVVLFLMAIIVLQKELYYKFLKWQFATFISGGSMIFIAGLYKAIYKLLYAAGVCDFERLNLIFFPLQATGFLIIGFAIMTFLFVREKDSRMNCSTVALAPAVFSGTIIFVVGMILGVMALCGALAAISARMKRFGTMVIFIISFIFMLTMGYLSTKTFDNELINWVAQGVNITGQGLFLVGALRLKKAGLRDFKF